MSIAELAPTTATRKILIIDDHPVVAEGWGRIISDRMPCEVMAAATTREGWQAWRKHQFDMLVVDLSIGDSKVAGLKFIERLRRVDRDVPILVFTMHDSPVMARRALTSGANGIINKDSPTGEIMEAFQTVMKSGSYVDTRFARSMALMDIRHAVPNRAALTNREEEILGLISEGLSYREIAERICISYKTVSNVTLTLKSKLGATHLADLVVKGIKYFDEM